MPFQTDMLNAFYRWSYKLSALSISKSPQPVRFGVLGAAAFAPDGLYEPAKSHPDVLVVAVAARSLARAQAHAQKYVIPNAYGSYDELLAQQDIDVVYIPLPIALHAEWAIKAMKAGKHVLIEKAMCLNAEEARAIQACARETGMVVMEAMHWQFHSAAHVVKTLVDSGKYGKLKACKTTLVLPVGMFPADDIRFDYGMGGGASLDLSYVFSSLRYFVGKAGKYEVLNAKARTNAKDSRIDDSMEAEFLYRPTHGSDEVRCHIHGDLAKPKILGFIPATFGDVRATLELERATIMFDNYVAPHLFHNITIENKVTGLTTSQKHYSFGPRWGSTGDVWWSTYRYQLEAFVAKVKGGSPQYWHNLEETVAMMEMIDQVYDKAGLVKRGMKASG